MEISPMQIVVCLDSDSQVYFVSRKEKKVIKSMDLSVDNQIGNILCMKKLNEQSVMIRDQEGVTFIGIEGMKKVRIMKESKY
jgi:hypothetical protein